MLADKLDHLAPPLLVREQALERLRDAIVGGTLAPGTRLTERELCEALGISRASVREVLRRLQAERLVADGGRRSPVVATLTRAQAAEIYEIRAMFEGLLVRRFTETATDAEVAELRAIFEAVRRAADAKAVGDIVTLMGRFNGHLLGVVGHGLVRDLLGQLDARINWLRVKAMGEPGRLAASLDELARVIGRIERRDADGAVAAIARSSANACEAALKQLAGGA